MKERVKKGSDEKREDALIQERKRTAILQKLKEQGGPFTSAEEVDDYLADLDDLNMKEKQKRMKLEITYARDTSTLLPKADPLFKIRKVDMKGKQRDKAAVEFGEALAILLGRKADRKAMDYSTFKECLRKMLSLVNVSCMTKYMDTKNDEIWEVISVCIPSSQCPKTG